MGSSQSQNMGSFLKELQEEFSLVKDVLDPRFGEIHIYKRNKSPIYIMAKSFWSTNKEEHQRFVSHLKFRDTLNHKNLLKLIGYYQSRQDSLCGDFNKVTYYSEFYFHDLEQELDKRFPKKEFMMEPELWYLLDSVSSACAYLEDQHLTHGDIRPKNIFLTPEGFVKLTDNGLLNNEKTGYVRMISGTDKAYLSPSLIRNLAQQSVNPKHDAFRSDIFSLGLTLLESASLISSISYYNFEKFTINFPLITQVINSLKPRYSTLLLNLISEMLNSDESLRPNFSEIRGLLEPYQENIRKMEDFAQKLDQKCSKIGQILSPLSNLETNLLNTPTTPNTQQYPLCVSTPTPLQNTNPLFYNSNIPQASVTKQNDPSVVYSKAVFSDSLRDKKENLGVISGTTHPSSHAEKNKSFPINQDVLNINHVSPLSYNSLDEGSSSLHNQTGRDEKLSGKIFSHPSDLRDLGQQAYFSREVLPDGSYRDITKFTAIDKKIEMAIKHSEETIKNHGYDESSFYQSKNVYRGDYY